SASGRPSVSASALKSIGDIACVVRSTSINSGLPYWLTTAVRSSISATSRGSAPCSSTMVAVTERSAASTMLTESAGDGCTTRQRRPRQRALAVVSPRSPVASTGQGAAIPSAAMRPDLLSAISRGSVAGDVVGVVVGSGAVAVGAMGVDVGGVAGVAVGAIGVGVGVDGTVEVGVRVVAAVGVDSIAVGVADAGVGDGGGPES